MLSGCPIKIAFVDFDGTLFDSSRQVSSADLDTLYWLGTIGVVRVLATGRSLYSLDRVVDNSLPFDYIMFSTGAGIIEWPGREIIYSQSMEEHSVRKVITWLIGRGTDFMVHHPVPANHGFQYYSKGKRHDDFNHRLSIYSSHAKPLFSPEDYHGNATQFVVITGDDRVLSEIRQNFEMEFNIIRTTSPLDHRTIWIEIFPPSVSKGHTADWLCQHLSVDPKQAFAIGNDYNDIELLGFAEYSFVTPDAPSPMKEIYRVTGGKGPALTEAIAALMPQTGME